MAALETDWKIPLFHRKKNRLEITDQGIKAFRHAKRILAHVEKMKEELGETLQKEGLLTISCRNEQIYTFLAAHFLRDFASRGYQMVRMAGEDGKRFLLEENAGVWIDTVEAEDPRIPCIGRLWNRLYVLVPENSPFYGAGSAKLQAFRGRHFFHTREVFADGGGILNEWMDQRQRQVMQRLLQITYVPDSVLRLLWERSENYFFVSSVSRIMNVSLRYLDEKRFVPLEDSFASMCWKLYAGKKCSKIVAVFQTWLNQSEDLEGFRQSKSAGEEGTG